MIYLCKEMIKQH
ncbi:hypothetical protein DBR11_27610, partial [Pedobacter sp. HMWF019]